MIKTEADRKDQWERLAWRTSARTGKPYDQAMGLVAARALEIYVWRLVRALLDEVKSGLGEGEATKGRFSELLNQYPYEDRGDKS